MVILENWRHSLLLKPISGMKILGNGPRLALESEVEGNAAVVRASPFSWLNLLVSENTFWNVVFIPNFHHAWTFECTED